MYDEVLDASLFTDKKVKVESNIKTTVSNHITCCGCWKPERRML